MNAILCAHPSRHDRIRQATVNLALNRDFCFLLARKWADAAVKAARWYETPEDVARRVVPNKSDSLRVRMGVAA